MTNGHSQDEPEKAATDGEGTEKRHSAQTNNAKELASYVYRCLEQSCMWIAALWQSWSPIDKFTCLIMIFTFFYSLVTLGLYNVTNTTMRLDQRAWVSVPHKAYPVDVRMDMPIKEFVQIVNIGKTPANKVRGYIVITILKTGAIPDFESLTARQGVEVGILWPNDPEPISLNALEYSTKQATEIKWSPDHQKAFDLSQEYMVVYGKLDYLDIFGTQHWTKFCAIATSKETKGSKRCVDYNDTDNNK